MYKLAGVPETVVANKNISGTASSPTTRTMIAREFLWTGFYFHLVVCADVIHLVPAKKSQPGRCTTLYKNNNNDDNIIVIAIYCNYY